MEYRITRTRVATCSLVKEACDRTQKWKIHLSISVECAVVSSGVVRHRSRKNCTTRHARCLTISTGALGNPRTAEQPSLPEHLSSLPPSPLPPSIFHYFARRPRSTFGYRGETETAFCELSGRLLATKATPIAPPPCAGGRHTWRR